MKRPRRCNPQCPPRRPDGTIVPPSFINLCLLCWNTGWVIPTGPENKLSIDQWIKKYTAKEPPP